MAAGSAVIPAGLEPVDYVDRWRRIVERRRVQMESAYAESGLRNVDYWGRRAKQYREALHSRPDEDPFFRSVLAAVSKESTLLDVGAVIHTHSVYASAFAVAGKAIPCVLDEQVVSLGGAVEVAEYGSSASEELAERAVAALGDRAAVLLRHHGVIGVGAELEEALAVVELVERVAQICVSAAALGGVRELPGDVVRSQQQIYRVMKGFRA
jgi:hypothetical protein